MYPTSFDPPNRAPLDFNTDRTARGVADAPGTAADRFAANVSCPDAESGRGSRVPVPGFESARSRFVQPLSSIETQGETPCLV